MEMMKKIGLMIIVIVLAMCMVVPAMAATPIPIPQMGEDGWVNPTGALYVSITCHHNLISKDVLIYRIEDNNTIFFVNGALVAKETYDMVPKMMDYPKTMLLNEGGQFDVFFHPGSYALKLNDGNGGQPEYALATLYQGGKTSVIFIGHAVSFDNGEAQCVPDETFTIVSAKYGAMGEDCKDVIDVPAHTEYAYWITGTPAHTEYSFRDWLPAGMMEVCYPEVNHTVHHDAVTHEVFSPEVNHTVHHDAVYETVVDVPAHTEYRIGTWQEITSEINAHYEIVTGDIFTGWCKEVSSNYDFTIGNKHYRTYKGNGNPQENGYPLKYLYTSHSDAVYGYVYSSYIDGICPVGEFSIGCIDPYPPVCEQINIPSTYKQVLVTEAYDEIVVDAPAHYDTIIDVPAYDEIVVDAPAHCDQEVDPNSPAHWGAWSAFSDTLVTPVPDQREVQTQLVPDDMTNGHYSSWSDTPEGSCIQQAMSIEGVQVNNPCITRNVPDTYKKECVDAGLYTDVTSQVQKLADDDINSFVFNNGQNPGGIFSTTGTLLAEIADPAPGIVKTIEIVYNNGCSGNKIIDAAEYETINLV